MNIIWDLILIGIIVLFAFIGKIRGFVKTFFSFFGSVISFVLASVFARPLGLFLSEKAILPVLKKYFITVFTEKAGEEMQKFDFYSLSESSRELLLRFQISEEKLDAFSVNAEDTILSAAEKMADSVLTPVAESLGYALSYILLFILLSFAIRILVKVFNLVDKLPIIHFSNHFLGLLVGILWGLFIAFLVSNLLALVEPMFFDSKFDLLRNFNMEKTYLVRWLSTADVFQFLIR